jgi:hypothetical protein
MSNVNITFKIKGDEAVSAIDDFGIANASAVNLRGKLGNEGAVQVRGAEGHYEVVVVKEFVDALRKLVSDKVREAPELPPAQHPDRLGRGAKHYGKGEKTFAEAVIPGEIRIGL